MSEYTNGQKGVALVADGKWDEGIELLSRAIQAVRSPSWLLSRAQAYQQTNEYDKALIDCEHAYLAALERQSSNRTSQLIEAQYRRGVLYFRKGQHANADACCVWAMRIALGKSLLEEDTVSKHVDSDGDYLATVEEAKQSKPAVAGPDTPLDVAAATGRSSWVRPYSFRCVVLGAMEKLPKGAPGRKITIPRVPNPPALTHDGVGEDKSKAAATATTSGPASEAKDSAAAAAAAPKEQKLRFDFFQTADTITLSVFVKGVDKEKFKVESMSSQTVILRNLPRSTNYAVLSLADDIIPSVTKHKVTGSKIELTFAKERPGQKWRNWGSERTLADVVLSLQDNPPAPPAKKPSVVRDGPDPFDHTSSDDDDDEPLGPAICQAVPPCPLQPPANAKAVAVPSGPPQYPTSSKSGPKDWDKVTGEQGDDDDGDDDAAKGDADQFFKKLFKGASPDTQRAMMKSFVESGGTALTTDWNDAKSRTFEVQPPDGVEAKKW